jgi:hypothetical protein
MVAHARRRLVLFMLAVATLGVAGASPALARVDDRFALAATTYLGGAGSDFANATVSLTDRSMSPATPTRSRGACSAVGRPTSHSRT